MSVGARHQYRTLGDRRGRRTRIKRGQEGRKGSEATSERRAERSGEDGAARGPLVRTYAENETAAAAARCHAPSAARLSSGTILLGMGSTPICTYEFQSNSTCLCFVSRFSNT